MDYPIARRAFYNFFQYLLQNYEYPIPKTQGDSRKQKRSSIHPFFGRFSQSKESTRTGRQERSFQANRCRETGHRVVLDQTPNRQQGPCVFFLEGRRTLAPASRTQHLMTATGITWLGKIDTLFGFFHISNPKKKSFGFILFCLLLESLVFRVSIVCVFLKIALILASMIHFLYKKNSFL